MDKASRLLLDVLRKYEGSPKWEDARFARVKVLPNTHVGEVGQDFVQALCDDAGLPYKLPMSKEGRRAKQHPWDIQIGGATFEVKTATEDTGGNFQFNHIRYHREYQAVLCVGISPSDVRLGAWSKAAVATGKAGHLVGMDKNTSATFKLTKKPSGLWPASEFKTRMREIIDGLAASG